MEVIIENGGLDCSVYNVKGDNRRYKDLLFLNQIIASINSSDDEEELRENMQLLFSKRVRHSLHGGTTRSFKYVFTGGTPPDYEDVTQMELYQIGKEKRLLVVNLKEN
jgi:hypothetical protein